MINFALLSFLDGESSFQDPGMIPLCLLTKTLKRPRSIVFNGSNSSFTAPRPGHNILWEMGKNGHKEGAFIIKLFFN
jgi:hypothetical protein